MLDSMCEEYTDIFEFEKEKITCNNFYQQKLRVKDDTPVYIKNYRLSQSQKEEIDSQVKKLMKYG